MPSSSWDKELATPDITYRHASLYAAYSRAGQGKLWKPSKKAKSKQTVRKVKKAK